MGTYRDKAGQWGNTKSAMSHTMFASNYFKCTHITLGYTFSKGLLSKTFLSNLRVYATVQNPFIFCDKYVVDPEQLSSSISNTDVITRNVMFGLDVSF